MNRAQAHAKQRALGHEHVCSYAPHGPGALLREVLDGGCLAMYMSAKEITSFRGWPSELLPSPVSYTHLTLPTKA